MELHRPHEHSPFRSWSAFLVEIATIVIGVMIALSFEGVREWQHNRSLAREARETIVRELTENKHSVDGDIKNAPKREQEIQQALRYVNDLLRSGSSSIHTLSLNVEQGDLRRSGWSTAQQMGALGYLAYGDVQKYAAAHDLQDLYQAQQRRSFEHMTDALVMIPAVFAPAPARSDLERFRDRLLVMGADQYMERQIATQLTDRYAKVLAE
jgi:hypothetical protein